jgi:hypothetical protein
MMMSRGILSLGDGMHRSGLAEIVPDANDQLTRSEQLASWYISTDEVNHILRQLATTFYLRSIRTTF